MRAPVGSLVPDGPGPPPPRAIRRTIPPHIININLFLVVEFLDSGKFSSDIFLTSHRRQTDFDDGSHDDDDEWLPRAGPVGQEGGHQVPVVLGVGWSVFFNIRLGGWAERRMLERPIVRPASAFLDCVLFGTGGSCEVQDFVEGVPESRPQIPWVLFFLPFSFFNCCSVR